MTAPARVCPSCKTPLPAEAGFCPSCGEATPTAISGETGTVRTPETTDTEERDYRKRLQRALGDGYELRDLIGRGGFGAVYAAWDVKLEREVAVKALRHDLFPTSELLERFEREAKSVAKLRHPNILPIHFVGEGEGITHMVMPKVEGESLRTRLQHEGQLSADEATRIAAETAKALQAAHDAGIIHRDVKPENILLEGDERHVLLMDFGIAKVAEGADAALTATGSSVGTPLYMSPEQAVGERQIDHRSDIYSLGCVLYEMLAGEPPFTGPSAQAIIARHISEVAPSLQIVRPGLAERIYSELHRALAKVPADRHTTASEFARFLAEEAASGRRVALPGVRNRWVAVVATLIAIGIAGVLFRTVPTQSPVTPSTDQQITFEGDVFSFSLSADGQFLAYISGDRLWVRELAGGEAIAVASPDTVQRGESQIVVSPYSPTWSPDGTRLLFARGRDVYEIPRLGGRERHVAADNDISAFAYAPDGESWVRLEGTIGGERPFVAIVEELSTNRVSDTVPLPTGWLGGDIDWSENDHWVVSSGTSGGSLIAVIARDGRVLDTLVIRTDHMDLSPPRWNGRGDAVYYVDASELVKLSVNRGTGRANGHRRALMSGTGMNGNLTPMDVSSDGRRIAYVRDRRDMHVWLMPVDGRSPEAIDSARRLTRGTMWRGDFAIAPDGRQVAVVAGPTGATSDLYLVPVESGNMERMTLLEASILSPQWSPDGRYIAFRTNASGQWQHMVLDMQDEVSMPVGEADAPAASFIGGNLGGWLDAHTFAYSPRDPDRLFANYLLAVDVVTGEKSRVAEQSFVTLVASPDGARVVGGDLEILDLAGGTTTELSVPGVPTAGVSTYPLLWTPDYIYFVARHRRAEGGTGRFELWRTRADASAASKLMDLPRACGDLRYSMSIDGQQLAYQTCFGATRDVWIADNLDADNR